jgi:hypothetical protein
MGHEARAKAAKKQTLTRQLPPMGLPGQPGYVLVHNKFIEGDVRNEIPVGGGPGSYRVIFTLARPGFFPVAEKEFSFDPDIPGDSHLAIAAPALTRHGEPNNPITGMKIWATTDEGAITFTCRPNPRGFLGRIETDLQASSLADAERRAHGALTASLSSLSAQLDIPLHLWRVHVTETQTGAVKISVLNPFAETMVMGGTGTMSQAYRWFAGLYREALQSNNRVYEFLCLFKIAEGILERRSRLASEAKAHGSEYVRPKERIPKEPTEFIPWLNGIFPPPRLWDEMAIHSIFVQNAVGRKFNALLQGELLDLRNAVAHALSDKTGEMQVSTDEALHIEMINAWLPITKCIVRRMLKNEFPDEFLSFLREDGTIAPSTP